MNGMSDIDRRAGALAEIQRMHEAMTAAAEEIGQLRADLHREQDRVVMMVEERDRYRHEAVHFRKLLIELATQLSNIGLMTRKADEVMTTVDEIDQKPTPSTEEVEKLVAAQPKPSAGGTLSELGKLQALLPSSVDGKR